ncbi:hypothetical protein D3Z38_19280 [Clostridiales bacterium]|uniref:Uncharacterized protein n=1 Tax=Muribaculaceae bacterium Z82 TaxID=2304548 RepID=A0A7C9NDN8_9BACT|nr:hypothetical protein [Clostridiales bacterium]
MSLSSGDHRPSQEGRPSSPSCDGSFPEGEEGVLERFGVTADELDARAAEYESGDWSDMEFGPIVQVLPK